MSFTVFNDFINLLRLWNIPKTHFPLNDAIIVVVEICSSGNKINGRIYQNPCH